MPLSRDEMIAHLKRIKKIAYARVVTNADETGGTP